MNIMFQSMPTIKKVWSIIFGIDLRGGQLFDEYSFTKWFWDHYKDMTGGVGDLDKEHNKEHTEVHNG